MKIIRSITIVVAMLLGCVYMPVLIIYHTIRYITYSTENFKVNDKWVESVGTLIYESGGRVGSGVKFKYAYNGKYYYGEWAIGGMENNEYFTGEKYVIKLDPQAPKNYAPVTWKPTFTNDEKIKQVTGSIDEICDVRSIMNYILLDKYHPLTDSDGYLYVHFSYDVEGRHFKHIQYLPSYYNKKSVINLLRKEKKYVVAYLVDDPRRSIIFIDDLIKNNSIRMPT